MLLPAVRSLPAAQIVVADGFSCREQIAQGTDRRGLHLAEVLHLALRQDRGDTIPAEHVERDYWGRSAIPHLRPVV